MFVRPKNETAASGGVADEVIMSRGSSWRFSQSSCITVCIFEADLFDYIFLFAIHVI